MGRKIKLVSWNINGLRAVWKKDFSGSFEKMDADVLGLQETKISDSQLTDDMRQIPGYESYWSFCSVKKGYSGVGVHSKIKPARVEYGIGIEEFDHEGRIIEMDFTDFIFFNIYFPNGGMSDERLQYKLDFYQNFFDYAENYRRKGRSLVISGDFNTAHNEIDLKNPKSNKNNSGFMQIERDWLDRIIENGYVDTFRIFNPDAVKYSWWTYRFKAREKNAGWRLDYFFVTRDIIEKGWVKKAFIDNDIYGSDHCPVGLIMEIPNQNVW